MIQGLGVLMPVVVVVLLIWVVLSFMLPLYVSQIRKDIKEVRKLLKDGKIKIVVEELPSGKSYTGRVETVA